MTTCPFTGTNWVTDLSVPFVDAGAVIFWLPSGTALHLCVAVNLLFKHPSSYFQQLWQNSVHVGYNYFLLSFIVLALCSKRKISQMTHDVSYALSQKYLSCGLNNETESRPWVTGTVQTPLSNAKYLTALICLCRKIKLFNVDGKLPLEYSLSTYWKVKNIVDKKCSRSLNFSHIELQFTFVLWRKWIFGINKKNNFYFDR